MKVGDLRSGDVFEFDEGATTAIGEPVPHTLARLGWFMRPHGEPDSPPDVAIVHGLIDDFATRRPGRDFSVSVDVDVELVEASKAVADFAITRAGSADVDPLRDGAAAGPLFGAADDRRPR